jgi:hypothetical protein
MRERYEKREVRESPEIEHRLVELNPHHSSLQGSPLKGPTTSAVIQPP